MYPSRTEEYKKKTWGSSEVKNTLSDDIARCDGEWVEDGADSCWREGCETCLRRTAKRPKYYSAIKPPAIIAFECEYLIEP